MSPSFAVPPEFRASLEPRFTVFFVLRGLYNGERGVKAEDNSGRFLADGWWYIRRAAEEPRGPFMSKEDCVEAAARVAPEDLEVDRIVQALLKGQLKPMTKENEMAFAGASRNSLIGQVGDWMVLVDFDPGSEGVHCEAHLMGYEGGQIVDLVRGTWEYA